MSRIVIALCAAALVVAVADPGHASVIASMTSLNTSDNPVAPGKSFTLTATVITEIPGPGGPAVTGTVSFYDDSTLIPGGGDVALSNGLATLTTAISQPGDYTILADYSGSSDNAPSRDSIIEHVVGPASAIPEPADVSLLGAALAGLLTRRRAALR